MHKAVKKYLLVEYARDQSSYFGYTHLNECEHMRERERERVRERERERERDVIQFHPMNKLHRQDAICCFILHRY